MPTLIDRLKRATPQQLRAFEMTAHHLSVTRAAEALHVTQPTVSVQLKELGEAIGEPLFAQQGRKLKLTPTAEALKVSLAEIHQCWLRFAERRAAIHGVIQGSLRIAAVTTAEYFVPDLLGRFAQSHPGVEIALAIENRDRVVDRLRAGLDDLTVMMLPPEDLPLSRAPFMENPLVVIAPRNHALAGKRIALEKLADERWLMREPGSGTRMAAERHFASAGFAPKVVMSLGSNEALKHAVGAGLGIAVISKLAVSGETATPITILPVRGFPLARAWSLVWRSDVPLAPAAERFVATLTQTNKAE
jgi:LysR family transcriptional regulator, low CO2-responsive transcriptional regulator